jgi:hypothetical protein
MIQDKNTQYTTTTMEASKWLNIITASLLNEVERLYALKDPPPSDWYKDGIKDPSIGRITGHLLHLSLVSAIEPA